MTPSPRWGFSIFMMLYSALWRLATPMLRFHKRLGDGFSVRCLKDKPLPEKTIWIHAASAGEAYIAAEIVNEFKKEGMDSTLVTTHTRQGYEVLEKQIPDTAFTFAPLDTPPLMERAFAMVKPELLVLVELEMWPGMLMAAKKRGTRIAIVNGRLTPKSHQGYARFKSLLRRVTPDLITAISDGDAQRLKDIFPDVDVTEVANIKFDRIPNASDKKTATPFPLETNNRTIHMLASVREEEEREVEAMAKGILAKNNDALITWFPRHMERVEPLMNALSQSGLACKKRSESKQVGPKTQIIIWDAFGEMGDAFQHAHAAFVGGSFAPLGGQNMMEPLSAGLVPVMGPSYSNFKWVGDDLVNAGLLILAKTPEEAAIHMTRIADSPQREKTINTFGSLIASKRGATQTTYIKLKELI